MPRTPSRRFRSAALLVTIGLLAACSGDDDSDGPDSANGGDGDYEMLLGSCDPLRGSGTITNRAGEPAAFRVTVAYEYTSEDLPNLRRDITPVLADGESFDFSVGPDPTGGSPSGCEIVDAERVAADEAAVAEVTEREAAAPDGEATSVSIEPLWTVAGIGGTVQAVTADDSIGYMTSSLDRGGAIYTIDLTTGNLIWEIESDLRFEQIVPDGRGGLLAASGTLLVAFDADGNETWQVAALRRTEGAPAGAIDHIAVDGDLVIVGGQAPGAIAGIDLATGEQRWHLAADEALSEAPIGFGGGGDMVTVTEHGVLVAGGTPSLRHLALFDLAGGAPEVRWSVPDVGTNATTDGTAVVDAAGGTVTAWDVATGGERWSATNADWETAPAAGEPAIVDDVVIVQRANSTVAFDLATGEQLWEAVDMPTYWGFLGSHVRYEGQVFGQVSLNQLVLLGSDGAVIDIAVEGDIRGTLSGVAQDGALVLLAARGSTQAQGSTAWVLDLDTVG